MKTLPAALAAHLSSGATTLSTCWRIARGDGLVLGFTDHDRTIVFDGIEHEPATGLDASDAVANAGFQVGGLEVTGALASDRITESDLQAGLYDNARVETWVVNWADPLQRQRLRVGSIGEVKRDGASFTAEVRSLSHALDQASGRLFRLTCDADLGDSRCKVDLSAGIWRADAVVVATDGAGRLSALLPGARATGFFDAGLLTFVGGVNGGRRSEVLRHVRDDGGDHIELWQAMVDPIAPGDAFVIRAGCDKLFATCRDRYANTSNFRGFPHMPGNDFALSYPSADTPQDGGKIAG